MFANLPLKQQSDCCVEKALCCHKPVSLPKFYDCALRFILPTLPDFVVRPTAEHVCMQVHTTTF